MEAQQGLQPQLPPQLPASSAPLFTQATLEECLAKDPELQENKELLMKLVGKMTVVDAAALVVPAPKGVTAVQIVNQEVNEQAKLDADLDAVALQKKQELAANQEQRRIQAEKDHAEATANGTQVSTPQKQEETPFAKLKREAAEDHNEMKDLDEDEPRKVKSRMEVAK